MNKQIIEMKKYGKFLHGREEGSFAFRKLREEVLGSLETVFVFNFDDVLVLAPTYITHAHRVAFETVEETRGIKFGYE